MFFLRVRAQQLEVLVMFNISSFFVCLFGGKENSVFPIVRQAGILEKPKLIGGVS